MGCGCGGGGSKKKPVNYAVRFRDGTTQTFATATDAMAAIRKAGGGTYRAVPAAA